MPYTPKPALWNFVNPEYQMTRAGTDYHRLPNSSIYLFLKMQVSGACDLGTIQNLSTVICVLDWTARHSLGCHHFMLLSQHTNLLPRQNILVGFIMFKVIHVRHRCHWQADVASPQLDYQYSNFLMSCFHRHLYVSCPPTRQLSIFQGSVLNRSGIFCTLTNLELHFLMDYVCLLWTLLVKVMI